jgi:serine protease AprX
VCAAAGNDGPAPGSIYTPGISRKVITVGAAGDDSAVNIWGNMKVNFSGRGPTKDCIHKPDILAPGTNIISAAPLPAFLSQSRKRELHYVTPHHIRMSGTSMATPYVSGTLARLIMKNPRLSPNRLKLMLKHSAKNQNLPQNTQGWGAIDLDKLLTMEATQ